MDGADTGIAPGGGPAILPFGRDGWLVRFAVRPEPWAIAAAQALRDAAESAPPEGVEEIAPSLVSVRFRFDPEEAPRGSVRAGIETLLEGRDWHAASPGDPARLWQVPVAFGGDHGPDLAAVAEAVGMTEDAAVQAICETPLRVLAIGFAPGQPYLGLLPEAFDLPRMTSLNPNVPPGAVALAVRQLVLFPNASPTGWRQVGRSAFRPFRPEAEDPVPLRAGDGLRLVAVSAPEMDALLDARDPAGGARCEVRR